MNINRNQYSYYQFNHNNKYEPSNILIFDPKRARREEYSKNLLKKNLNFQRPKSYKRTGNPNQTNDINDINNNKYNSNYYANSIGKQRNNDLFNDFHIMRQDNYWNENKKETSIFNNRTHYGDIKTNEYNFKDYYKYRDRNNDFSKRLIYGGRFLYNNDDYTKSFNAKTVINKPSKNSFLHNEKKDNLYRTNYEQNFNEKNITNYEGKPKTALLSDFINPKSKNNEKDMVALIDNKKIINNIDENKNYNYSEGFNNISNNKEGKNHNINYKYYNNEKNINKFDKLNEEINKDIEVISESSTDFLQQEINSKTTIHHKSNTQKSKSVNPYNNSSASEAYQISNSIIGLNNLGATCYMNSALQNIIHCKKFIEKLISFKNNNKSNQILTNSFLNVCCSLLENKYSRERNYTSSYYYSLNSFSFSPSNFKRDFCSKHKDYIRGQHDSIEFLRTLLDDISKEININQNISAYKELTTEGKSKEEQSKEYHNFFIERENSIIIDIFYIQIINIFTCKCGFESYSFQKLLDIPLLLPMKIRETDLISLIKEYLKEEALDWSKECEKCKKANLVHAKKIKFSMINDVVIFSLQRFDPYFSIKSNINVSYREYIDLKEFCDYDLYKENTKYRLFGTINHIGNINYGHYYAYVRIGEMWYEFNDSIVKKINSMDLKSSSVCVLFYEKI